MAPSQGPNVRGEQLVGITFAFTALAALFVILRCITRFGFARTWFVEDIAIICALVFSTAYTALVLVQEPHGLGRHYASLSPAQDAALRKPFWSSIIIYYLCLTMVKVSILLQYQRFFMGKKLRSFTWTLLGTLVAYGIYSAVGSNFICTPDASRLDEAVPKVCLNVSAFWYANAAFNIVTDILICVLPIPVLMTLQLPRKEKYSLMAVFALGGFGCITSILRLLSLIAMVRSSDVTWGAVSTIAWSAAEINVGIVCACLPTLRTLLKRFFRRLVSTRQVTVELRQDPTLRHPDRGNTEREIEDSDTETFHDFLAREQRSMKQESVLETIVVERV